MMLKIFVFCLCLYGASAYFTLPGKCPENVKLHENFRLADFYGTWYQAYHYSSDGQDLNKCSTIETILASTGVFLNQSRVDRGLFHRYSIGKIEMPTIFEVGAKLDVTFTFDKAPRRLKNRRYPFRILATNYHYYATVYTCQYSALIDKHFSEYEIDSNTNYTALKQTEWIYSRSDDFRPSHHIGHIYYYCCYGIFCEYFQVYVWLLSRRPLLNDVSKELAIKPLSSIGVDSAKLVKDDNSNCHPKYFEEEEETDTEPLTFRFPVPI